MFRGVGHSNDKRGYQARPWTHKKHPKYICLGLKFASLNLKLHWLPVKYRIMYKILILTYKCIHGAAPIYLQELIQEYKPCRNLRSSSQFNFVSTCVSTLSYGHRSFCKASADLWNKLPQHIKYCQTINQFKTSLKTHLFTMAFDD